MKSNYIAPQVEVSTISLCTMLCGSATGPMSSPKLGIGGTGSDYELAD